MPIKPIKIEKDPNTPQYGYDDPVLDNVMKGADIREPVANPYPDIVANNPVPQPEQPNIYEQGVYGVIKSPMKAYAFEKSYWGIPVGEPKPEDTIKLQDKRTIDSVTGKPMTDTSRFNNSVSRKTITDIIQSAHERGIDPHTALAMSLQETGITPFNPLHDNAQDMHSYDVMKRYAEKYPDGINSKIVIDESMNNLAAKIAYAKKLGKTSEADVIQGWNGYGKINNVYGIPGEIDMHKNPVYGKRIIDLRDNIIKKNPEILKMIADYKRNGMAEGGIVKGSGTAKSDSIPAKLNQGDFIVPADKAQLAMAIGEKHLGWDRNQEADMSEGGIDKHLSNGEVRFTSDEVHQLSKKGIDISDLAQNAKISNKMATGGQVYPNLYQDPNTYEGDPIIPQPSAIPFVHPEDATTDYSAPAPVSAPLQQAQQASTVPQPSNDEIKAGIIKRLFATSETKPTIDLEKQARLQKMGKINQVGRGIGLLTDALSLGLGGQVKRRGPDNVSPAIYQSYQNSLDKFRDDTTSWGLRNTAQKRANIGMELEIQYKKEANQLQRDKMVLEDKIRQAKDATETAHWQMKYDQTEREIKQRAEQHDRDMNLRYPGGVKAGTNKANKPISLMTSSGKKYQLPPEELSYLTNEATGNEAITSDPKFSKWFDKVEITKQVPNTRWGGYDKTPTGQYTYKLKPSADKHALSQSMLELWEQGKISLPGRKDQPRNESDSTVPAWTPPVPGTVTGPAVGRYAPQQQAPAPVLKPQPAGTPKKQYSTGGLY